jgi:AmmeMemoRadiSam system protein A
METNTHPYVTLAIQAVQHYLDHGVPLPCPDNLAENMKDPKSVFVSIKNGSKLRGCIGDLTPSQNTLAKEIIHNATSAANRDPRFPPVTLDELPDLTFSVDVLTPLEKVEDVSELDCKQYGLAVKTGKRLGVLLPDLDGVDNVAEQLRICLKKGGIDKDEPIEMYRFEVVRYH